MLFAPNLYGIALERLQDFSYPRFQECVDVLHIVQFTPVFKTIQSKMHFGEVL